MAKENWSAKEYLASLATPSTRNNYQTSLKQFFEFTFKVELGKRDYIDKLDELSKRYLSEQRDFEKDYVLFHTHLKDKAAPKTLDLRCLAVRGFYEFNGLTISRGILTRVNGRKAVEAISEEKIPKREELKVILSNIPLHVKTLALIILSAGLRPGEALSLRLDDLEDVGDLTRINLKGRGTKTGRKRFTYISPEAKRTLDLWLKGRNEFRRRISQSMLVSQRAETYMKSTEDRVFPFNYNTANKVWASALRKSSLMKRDRETDRVTLRLHNLRKYFSTRGKWSDKDIVDFLQGHQSGVRAVYNRYDEAEETVRAAYVEAIPSLTIFEDGGDKAVLDDLSEKLAAKDSEIAELKSTQVIMQNSIDKIYAMLDQSNRQNQQLSREFYNYQSPQEREVFLKKSVDAQIHEIEQSLIDGSLPEHNRGPALRLLSALRQGWRGPWEYLEPKS